MKRPASGPEPLSSGAALTKREVLAKLAKVRADIDAGLPVVDRTQTVSAYLAWWADNVLPGTVRDTTADTYLYTLRRYVEPHIGTRRLAELGPEHVLSMLRTLGTEGTRTAPGFKPGRCYVGR